MALMDSPTTITSRDERTSRARGADGTGGGPARGGSRLWRWLRNGGTAIAVLLAVYALLGFLILPTIVKPRLEAALTARTGRQATLGRLEFNPFTLHARLLDFAMADRDPKRPFVRFAALDVDISPASLRYRAPVLDAIHLVQPRIDLTRNEDGTSSVADLAQREPVPGTGPALFSLNNIEIDDATVTLDDRVRGHRLVVSNLGVGIPFVSDLPHDATIRVTPHVEGSLDGTRFVLNANTSSPFLERREATLDLDFDALPLARYAEYVDLPGGMKVADGTLTTRLKLAFVSERNVPQSVLLTGTGRVDKLAVVRKDGTPLAAARTIEVALEKVDGLAHSVTVERLRVEAPEADLRRTESGALELASLAAAPSGAPPSAAPGGKAWTFRLADASVVDGKLHFRDRSVSPAFATTLSGITVAAKAIASSGPPGKVEVAFDTDDGAHAALRADASIADAALRGHAKVTKLDLPRLSAYYASALNADIRRGTLDLEGDFDASTKPAPGRFTLAGVSASLAGMEAALRDEREPFLRISTLAIAGLALDARKRSVVIDEARWREGSLRVLRQGDGTLALERLVRGPGAPPAAGAATTKDAAAEAGWSVVARKASVERVVADVEDRVPKPAVKLRVSDVRIAAENVGNAAAGSARLDVGARIGARGRAHVQGTLEKAPLRADLHVAASGIDIVPFKPYLEARTNVIVTGGAVEANGRVVYAAAAQGAPRVSYRGEAAIVDFGSLDRPMSQDLVRFRTLRLTGIDATSDPLRVSVGAIAMDGFFARAILSADARLNLKDLLAPASAPSPPSSEAKTAGGVTTKELAAPSAGGPLPVSIGRIELSNGEVQYSDFFVQPNYNAHLTDVSGSVSSMSAAQAGDVDVAARVEGTAPVELRGTVNPFSTQLALDLTGKATDVDLPPLTPYSVKYAGYGIEKGKLSLEVHYRIDDRKLAATNHLRLDQLTFGQHVDSPTATKLPVLLAVSLLKDRNGVITLDLPIQGTLDDPKFSVWGVIVQIFVNLITKAVTAPFALLASIGGGGEQLAYVEFAPGRSDLSAAAVEKLRTLARALNDRPALKLDASGRAIPDVDRDGMKQAALDGALRAQKQKDLAGKGQSAPPLDTLTIDSAEQPALLAEVYDNADLPGKPRNVLGIAKSIPPAEMEALLLASYRVDDEALATLANRRAQAIKEWFAKEGGVAPERIFIVKPKLGGDGISDAGARTRVDFAIR